MINRRGLLRSLLAAPAVITTPGLLMPVRQVLLPPTPELVTEWRAITLLWKMVRQATAGGKLVEIGNGYWALERVAAEAEKGAA